MYEYAYCPRIEIDTGNKLEVRLRDIEKKYDVAQSEIEKFKTQEKLYRGKIRKLLINRGIEYIEDMYDAMVCPCSMLASE